MSNQQDMGDPSGAGSSPSVEPAKSGLDASHSIPIAGHVRSLARHIDQAKYRTTSPHGAPVATGYEYIEMPLWEARHLHDVLVCTAQGIEAHRAETGTGSVHESPVGSADAHTTRRSTLPEGECAYCDRTRYACF
jgi:hypothetical protein